MWKSPYESQQDQLTFVQSHDYSLQFPCIIFSGSFSIFFLHFCHHIQWKVQDLQRFTTEPIWLKNQKVLFFRLDLVVSPNSDVPIMPLPWKKVKGSRISQLVADHLHSPKPGGSLVVQTGFPTSLIDLFVKNRDRLKKPSKKRRSKALDPMISQPPFKDSLDPDTNPVSGLLVSELRNPSPGNQGPMSCLMESPTGNEVVEKEAAPCIKQGGVVVACGGGPIVAETARGEVSATNGVYLAILRIFLVVVLALGTKKFAVGITLSVFFLLFFEYVGKCLCRSLKPCLNAQKRLRLMIQSVLCFLGIKLKKVNSGSNASMGQEESTLCGCSNPNESNKVRTLTEEIQIAQSNSNLVSPVGEIQREEVKFSTVGYNKQLVYEEMDSKKRFVEKKEDGGCNSSGLKIQRSSRARIKSKICKLVPKKLRTSKKKSTYSKGEAYDPSGEGKVNIHERQKEEEVGEVSESDDKLSSLSSERYRGEESVFRVAGSFRKSLPSDMEVTIIREEEVAKGNSGCLVLCLIVLLGLMGGRILALMLTLLWCLMLRSGEALRRYIKIPIVRSCCFL